MLDHVWVICETCDGTGRTVRDGFGSDVTAPVVWGSANSNDRPPGGPCKRCGGHGIRRIEG